MPVGSSTVRAVRMMRDGSAGSGFQNAISVIRYASAMMRSAKPNAWKVSTLRAWMPSAWPIARRPPRRSMMRVVTPGNCDELRGGDHAGGPGADDQHVDLVGQLLGAVDADAGGRLDARVARHVAVVVELHALSSLRCVGACSIIESSIRIANRR